MRPGHWRPLVKQGQTRRARRLAPWPTVGTREGEPPPPAGPPENKCLPTSGVLWGQNTDEHTKKGTPEPPDDSKSALQGGYDEDSPNRALYKPNGNETSDKHKRTEKMSNFTWLCWTLQENKPSTFNARACDGVTCYS